MFEGLDDLLQDIGVINDDEGEYKKNKKDKMVDFLFLF